jgi:hypothetical protein
MILKVIREDDLDYARCLVESLYVGDDIVTYYDHDMEQIVGAAKLTLLKLVKSDVPEFESGLAPIHWCNERWVMVLADGTSHLVKAVVSTSLNDMFWKDTPNVGATIHVFQTAVLQQGRDNDSTTRASLLIMKMRWVQPPRCDPKNSQVLYFDSAAIDRALTGRLVITVHKKNKQQNNTPMFIFTERHLEDIAQGVGFFFDENRAKANIIFLRERLRSILLGKRPCQCRRYGFKECAILVVPPDEIDYRDLFDSLSLSGLVRNEKAQAFSELPPKDKRRALYWWYSVNLLGFPKSQQMPSCLYHAIRLLHPDKAADKSPLRMRVLFPEK